MRGIHRSILGRGKSNKEKQGTPVNLKFEFQPERGISCQRVVGNANICLIGQGVILS